MRLHSLATLLFSLSASFVGAEIGSLGPPDCQASLMPLQPYLPRHNGLDLHQNQKPKSALPPLSSYWSGSSITTTEKELT